MSPHSLYKALVQPRSEHPTDQSRELTLNVLLVGTLVFSLLVTIQLVIQVISQHHDFAVVRLLMCLCVGAFFSALLFLSRKGHYHLASYIFVLVYLLIVMVMVVTWSILIPQGVLLAAFVIILSGALLGSRTALYAALLNVALFTGAFLWAESDTSWEQNTPVIGDILGFGVTFGLIAVVCWLFTSHIEQSLDRAERSEAALRRQKDVLEKTVEQRTKKLQAVQVEQVQQVYRFAELGLVSTAMLHDLANHMSTISLDIAGLEDKDSSEILARIRRTVHYIDDTVQKTRRQLDGQVSSGRFEVQQLLAEVVDLLSYQAQQQGIQLEVSAPKKSISLQGDDLRFRQLLANIIMNGIDAYQGTKQKDPVVKIAVEASRDKVTIAISDRGAGINTDQQKNLFQPFYTTKKKGMGLGLFTSKEIIEKAFGGRIAVTSNEDGTVFSLSVPRRRT